MKSNTILKTIALSLSFFLLINAISHAQNDPTADSWENIGTTIFTNNNVGIGQTNPVYKLQVTTPSTTYSGLGLEGKIPSIYSEGGFALPSANFANNSNIGAWVGTYNDTNNDGVFNNADINSLANGANLAFYLSQPAGGWASNNKPAMIITAINNYYGYVGIGTTTPQHKLDVDGFVRCEELLIEDVTVPDYVFTEDYDLPSIDEEAAFIQKNGHLIGYQSANEMNGKIHLSDYTTRNHEKIEVLILHTIELNEENKKLKSEIAEMKKMLETLLSQN